MKYLHFDLPVLVVRLYETRTDGIEDDRDYFSAVRTRVGIAARMDGELLIPLSLHLPQSFFTFCVN